MRLLKTLKSLKFLLAIFSMLFCFTVFANTGPADKKVEDKEQVQESNIPQDQSSSETLEKTDGEDKQVRDEEETISNSSFNYFFFLIYKIKFQEVFRFPNKGAQNNGVSIHRVNINALIERLTKHKI